MLPGTPQSCSWCVEGAGSLPGAGRCTVQPRLWPCAVSLSALAHTSWLTARLSALSQPDVAFNVKGSAGNWVHSSLSTKLISQFYGFVESSEILL